MKVSFITLTNNGYKNLTKNCLLSLKKLGINYLKVFCIDQESYDFLSKDFNNIYKLDLDENEIESNLINFRTKNWSKIVYKKFNLIYKELQNYDYVLFTDGDIFFEKKDFLEYCLHNIGTNDIIIQDDRVNDKSIIVDGKQLNVDYIQLCTGFMLIKNNEKMKYLFNPKNIPEDLDIKCDQDYVNKNINNFKYKLLPMELFPNGSYFRLNKTPNKFMVHFNWIIGSIKIEKMKKYNYWLL